MRVLELSLRNYRVFEEVDLELPARVIGIFGPNGAGKSTLVESIAFALYGADATRTTPAAGARSPIIVLSSVDLPAPFGPMIPTISPSRRKKLQPVRMFTPGT